MGSAGLASFPKGIAAGGREVTEQSCAWLGHAIPHTPDIFQLLTTQFSPTQLPVPPAMISVPKSEPRSVCIGAGRSWCCSRDAASLAPVTLMPQPKFISAPWGPAAEHLGAGFALSLGCSHHPATKEQKVFKHPQAHPGL